MKQKTKIANRKKYSKPVAQPKREVVKKPEFVLTEDSVVVVTTIIPGRFKTYGFDDSKTSKERKEIRKENLRKMRASWILSETKEKGKTIRLTSHDGVHWRPLKNGEMPPNYFVAKNDHIDAETFEVKEVRRLQGRYCMSFLEEDNRPYSIKKEVWEKLSRREKFMSHIVLLSDGPSIVEIIN